MVQEVVDAAEVKHVSVYLSLGTTQGGLHRRRALQQAAPTPSPSRVVKEPLKGFGPYTTCGTLCQVSTENSQQLNTLNRVNFIKCQLHCLQRNYKTPDSDCSCMKLSSQTQVRWLEALLAVLFMALAICSGEMLMEVAKQELVSPFVVSPYLFEIRKVASICFILPLDRSHMLERPQHTHEVRVAH